MHRGTPFVGHWRNETSSSCDAPSDPDSSKGPGRFAGRVPVSWAPSEQCRPLGYPARRGRQGEAIVARAPAPGSCLRRNVGCRGARGATRILGRRRRLRHPRRAQPCDLRRAATLVDPNGPGPARADRRLCRGRIRAGDGPTRCVRHHDGSRRGQHRRRDGGGARGSLARPSPLDPGPEPAARGTHRSFLAPREPAAEGADGSRRDVVCDGGAGGSDPDDGRAWSDAGVRRPARPRIPGDPARLPRRAGDVGTRAAGA
jgi:hypothetical protein